MLNVLCGTYGRMLFLSNQLPILWDRLFPLILSAAFTISMIILLCAPFSFYCTELYCIEINLAKKINNLGNINLRASPHRHMNMKYNIYII